MILQTYLKLTLYQFSALNEIVILSFWFAVPPSPQSTHLPSFNKSTLLFTNSPRLFFFFKLHCTCHQLHSTFINSILLFISITLLFINCPLLFISCTLLFSNCFRKGTVQLMSRTWLTKSRASAAFYSSATLCSLLVTFYCSSQLLYMLTALCFQSAVLYPFPDCTFSFSLSTVLYFFHYLHFSSDALLFFVNCATLHQQCSTVYLLHFTSYTEYFAILCSVISSYDY